jgi:hypothetical protein
MEKELLNFLKNNTMVSKGHDCQNCRSHYLNLIKLMRKNKNYKIILTKDYSYNYLHIKAIN